MVALDAVVGVAVGTMPCRWQQLLQHRRIQPRLIGGDLDGRDLGRANGPLEDVAFGPDGSLLVDGRIQVFNAQRELGGVWPADPSPDHLGALALDGEQLWVEAPYPDKLFELKVSWTS